MADYTEISNVSVEPLAPVTSELMTSLRDNPIAISEGAVGAPRMQADATGGSVAGDNLLFKSVPTRVAGDDATSPWTLVNSSTCFRATTTCGIRITVTRVSSTAFFGYRIVKNNVVVATTISADFLSADISLVAGDVIWVEARGGSGSGMGATPGDVTTVTEYKVGDIRSVGGI